MSKKRNEMDALVAKLVRPHTDTPSSRPAPGTEERPPIPTTGAAERKTYKRKPEAAPRQEVSQALIDDLELTPDMVKAINKIRERDRTAREKDTRTSPTYGLKQGYRRYTLPVNDKQLAALKEIAKEREINFYLLVEEIFNEYINRYDNDKR